ncbi:dynamin family protein [Spirulina subsalsa FACHB-351]|uniref:Dynamin family protein n=1 Tax=Spirulina subsalsa FACHB-351 TaxID=234711 RepID=A0ABT3L923_9CYAN|nr:dynamin family protein [Spirulina subsalsa]MCW6037599.1 dynamin family protein [Spirulina subsalsa FACHB-351]
MSSQLFQETHSNINNTGARLLQYIRELRNAQLEGDDTEALQKIEQGIQKALTALHEQRYQVAVIAAMKAGKSTFLNALIGSDVLASETEACTVCRTDVKPIPPTASPCLLEYREGHSEPVAVAEGESFLIRHHFLERNHLIRATGNRDHTTRFELHHPIAAIQDLPSLQGFTLVDTPGPNEWKSAGLDSISLKQTALEALRNCDVILFILDYCSFKDNTNSELLQDLIQQRSEFLTRNRGVIYFILNKIDRQTEEDRPIAHVVDDLRRTLNEFGIPNPIIYPASAWQGLLSKLIAQGIATESHLKDFKHFFSARYAKETEDGDLMIPSPKKIAPQALQDSLIPIIEKSVVQDVVNNSGWNLLRDVLAKLDKSAKEVEDILNARISGWKIEIKPLRQRMEEYKRLAKSAIVQIRGVKKLVEQQEQKLVNQFKREIVEFAERAKLTIQQEFEIFAQYRFSELTTTSTPLQLDFPSKSTPTFAGFPVPQRLGESLKKAVRDLLGDEENPYAIRCTSQEEVEKIKQDINRFCSILIKDWWTNTQDKLSRDGTLIRQELVAQIRDNVQQISNELSQYLGEALEITMNINPIQMLVFDFQGIDTQVQRQTENYTRWKKEQKKAFCRDYEVDIQVDDRRSYYEIDLRLTMEAIKREIDAQTTGSLVVVERVIKKQVSEDFSNAEQQINDYINRFLIEFDRLLRERELREAQVDEILATLEVQKSLLHQYVDEFESIRDSLEMWKPR